MRCPSQEELSQFGRGLLDGVRFDTIAFHLEECDTCESHLAALDSGSPLISPALNASAQRLSWAESAGARHLTKHLLKGENRPSDEDAPEEIGRIKLIRYLASGSFGRVFLGWDEELDRKVAVKLPRIGVNLDDETKDRIRQEARLAARLSHPGIVPIYDIGTNDDDEIYLVTAFVDGMDLSEWRKQEQPSLRRCVELIARVAEIVQYAHEQNLIHRDIKPSNIMIDRSGKPHLVDFGLSRTFQSPHDHAADGQAGTPAYMPPENLDYVLPPLDPRGDVYSIGVVLYELLTGARPLELQTDNWKETLKTVEPKPPRSKNRSIPARLERICLKAIDKTPHRRYATAEQLATALRRFLEGADRQKLRERFPQLTGAAVQYLIPAAIVIFGMFAYAFSDRSSLGVFEEEGIATEFLSVPIEEPEELAPVSVTVRTEPPGAMIAVVPLGEVDGAVREQDVIRPPVPSPVTIEVPEGEYFVEAVLPGRGFHQVYRTVGPTAEVELGTVSWPKIAVPNNLQHPPEGMVWVAGGTYQSGPRSDAGAAIIRGQVDRQVDAFWIAAREATYRDYAQAMGDLTVDMKRHVSLEEHGDDPLGWLSYQEAVAFAERSGLRLLTQSEWEYVATNQGTTDFPWGDEFHNVATWDELTPLDRTIGSNPVYGLYSGSGEWTSSKRRQIPGASPVIRQNGGLNRPFRLFQGIPSEIAQGRLSLTEFLKQQKSQNGWFGSRWSTEWATIDDRYEKLGARLARDATPRYLSIE